MQKRYDFLAVERKIQQFWKNHKSFSASERADKEKFYCLSMLPYPSGALHMGHVRNYTLNDVISRYQRALGKNVLHPMGWDAFGLPAENAAIKHKQHPLAWTKKNISCMRNQFDALGFSFDWNREITTCSPDYYRWEQWFFIQLYKKNLVYRKKSPVNWDPADQTVLANEQVINGRGWRSGAKIEQKKVSQWFIKINSYANELLTSLDLLVGWPDAVKKMQANWIGRSRGLTISFVLDNSDIKVFTTRPDTIMGVTYLAIAPMHRVALQIAEKNSKIAEFITQCQRTVTAEASLARQSKQGIKLPVVARHPITGKTLEVWIANFVIMGYGTGATMAVPAHDQRDWEFAKRYNLPIQKVIIPRYQQSSFDLTQKASPNPGTLINSGQFNGLSSNEASEEISSYLIKNKKGEKTTVFRIRDWGVSRQRFWGCPIPMIHCLNCGIVPEKIENLPVILPANLFKNDEAYYSLKQIPEFYGTQCPECGNSAQRETDTFDTFVESSWYYARYACPNANAMLNDEVNYWLPVDQYIGGVEHATLHLLYSRFFHKLMRDVGLVKSDEPFCKLLTQGMVLNNGSKMSKSRGNIVDPELLINRYGADTVRLFIICAAPPEQSLEYSDQGIEGAHRFLKKLWRYAYDNRVQLCGDYHNSKIRYIDNIEKNNHSEIHKILQKALFDLEKNQLNTVASAAMKIFNILKKLKDPCLIKEEFSLLLRLLSPFAPHITQYLWDKLKFGNNILHAPFPRVNPEALSSRVMMIVVQVNGRLRARITIESDADQSYIEKCATQHVNVRCMLAKKQVTNIIYVPKKVINIVTKKEL